MHMASRVQEVPQPASPEGGEDRRPPIPGRDRSAEAEDRSRQARRPESIAPPAEAGRNTLRCLQLRSDQQWEEEIPLELPRKIPRKNERISLAGEQSEQGTKRGPQVARTRNPAPRADEQRRQHWLVGTPYRDHWPGKPGTEATRRRRRHRRSRRSSTKRGCFLIESRRAQLTPRSGCRSNRSCPTLWPLPVTTGGNVEAAHPTKRGVTAAYISETTGGWATVTVTTPSRSSRLARQPLSPYRERTEERSDRTHDHYRSRKRREGSRNRNRSQRPPWWAR